MDRVDGDRSASVQRLQGSHNDLARRRDGSVEILDEDEFAEHIEALAYPPHVIDRARTTTARLYLELERRTEPFGAVAEQWIAHARDLPATP